MRAYLLVDFQVNGEATPDSNPPAHGTPPSRSSDNTLAQAIGTSLVEVDPYLGRVCIAEPYAHQSAFQYGHSAIQTHPTDRMTPIPGSVTRLPTTDAEADQHRPRRLGRRLCRTVGDRPQSRLTADAETFLHRLVLLALLLRRPDEQAEDDEDCEQEDDNKNDFDSRLHTTMIPDRRHGKGRELVDL
jgi:hypothetical protein